MHALVYTGTEKIVYREEKDPIKKPGESLVKVYASGICGSDMHAYHGKDERRIPPLILGHEFSGISLDGKFKNKNVIISGGSGFLGEQISQAFLKQGSNVFILDLNKPSLIEVWGLKLSFFWAFEISASVNFISPGCKSR